jgi:predicted ribosomally synthesized peptide with SipW-like signal peptide
MRKLTKKAAAVSAAAVLLLGGGAAYAYWTNTGTGTGTATTGTNVGITVNQTSIITAMYPGQASQTLAGNFTSTNAGATHVTAVTATGYIIDAAHVSAGCTVGGGNYTLGGTAPVGADVPTGTNQGSWTGLTIIMNNLGTNQDFCKGATVTITYASS